MRKTIVLEGMRLCFGGIIDRFISRKEFKLIYTRVYPPGCDIKEEPFAYDALLFLTFNGILLAFIYIFFRRIWRGKRVCVCCVLDVVVVLA